MRVRCFSRVIVFLIAEMIAFVGHQREAIAQGSLTLPFAGVGYQVNAYFDRDSNEGSVRDVLGQASTWYLGRAYDQHKGTDYGLGKVDALAVSASSGIVDKWLDDQDQCEQIGNDSKGIIWRCNGNSPLGNNVRINHGNGLVTIYGHLKRNSVKYFIEKLETDDKGNRIVDRGTPLGIVGTTGRSTGPHLHFQVEVNGLPIDPYSGNSIWATNPPTTPDAVPYWYLFVQSEDRNGGQEKVGNPQGIMPGSIGNTDCLIQNYSGGQFGNSVMVLDRSHHFADAYLIRTGFYDFWVNNKNQLGPPINDEYRNGAISRQDFQKGYLTWDSQNGVKSFVYVAPGEYSGKEFRVSSGAFVMAYNHNGAAGNVGEALPSSNAVPATVHSWGTTNYEVQNFGGGKWGWNAIIRHADSEIAYLVRTGFWETYKLKGGPVYFGAPQNDEYINHEGILGFVIGWPRQDFENGYSMMWNPLLKKVHVLRSNNAIYSILFGIGGGSGDDTPSTLVRIPNGGEVWQAGTTQRITWSASDDVGIENTALQYSLDDGLTWQEIATFQNGLTTQYLWAVPNASSTSARIRVIAQDGVGNTGLDASDGAFTITVAESALSAPTMFEPSVSGRNYNIAWQAVSGAQSYLLQEDTTPSFANPLEYNFNLTGRYFSGRADGLYYYRVSAVNSQGHGAWSSTKYAVVTDQPPGEITSMTPANGATNQSLSVTLSWNSTHPAGKSVKYNVWFSPEDVSFFSPNRLVSAQQEGTSYTVYNLPYSAICSWRIEAIDETGRNRESPIYKFTTSADNTSPSGGISINAGATTTNTYSVSLQLSATDTEAGIGWMRLSNNGNSWTFWMNFSTNLNWNLAESQSGGRPNQTIYTVYAQFKDKRGNESIVYSDTIDKTAGTPGLILLKGDEYATIRDAMAAAASGDTIILTQGVYTIPDKLSPPRYPSRYVGIVMNPGVTLMGAGAEKTEIICETGWYTVIDADNSVIQGLTIVGGQPVTVRAESVASKITHCIIKGATESGIGISSGSGIEVSNNLIINNAVGIRNQGSNNRLYNNVIAFNNSDGVSSSDNNAVFKNNIIAFNNLKGVAVTPSTIFQNNDVYGNSSGNYYATSGWLNDQTGVNGNISSNPSFVNAGTGNYQLNSNSPGINAGTNVGIPGNGTPDMGAFEYNGTGTLQVLSSNPGAAFTITGPQTYTGSGSSWSTSGAPIGIYSISFAPILNHNTPRYMSKLLQSGETLVFNGNYSPDQEPPAASISTNFGEYATPDSLVAIAISASDGVAGMGAGAQMQFSNDGSVWSPLEPFSTLKAGWDVSTYGGSLSQGMKTIYAKVSDTVGNFTATLSDTILYVPNRRILTVPDEYSTIQAAVDAAQAGDMVWVAPGSYVEDVVLKPGIRLQGAGARLTSLRNASSYAVLGANNSMVDGLTLLGGFKAVEISSASPIISNCIISAMYGVTIWGDSHGIIRNSILKSCTISGIRIDGTPDRRTRATIENNTFYGNGAGVDLSSAQVNTRVESVNNLLASNTYAIRDDNPNDREHDHIYSSFSYFWGNSGGNFFGQNSNRILSIADGLLDPEFVNPTGGEFNFQAQSSAINAGNPEARYNDVDGTQNDIGAYGGPSTNTPPVADFTIDSQLGGIGSEFAFDAGTSVDREIATSKLNFRWDWNEDGVFDTPFSSNPRIAYSFTSTGEKSVVLQVRDSGGFVGSTTKQVTVTNRAPDAPSNPIPVDGVRGEALNIAPPDTLILLQWTSRDADAGDFVRYDLYFGAGGVLAKIGSALADTSYTVRGLTYNTLYSWRVDATDRHGARVEGPTWVFVTEPEPLPPTPENLQAEVVSYQTVRLSWSASSERTLGYRIERRAEGDTAFALINVVEADSTHYTDRANLLGLTEYRYRVSALNASGRSAYSNEVADTTYSDLSGDVNNDAAVNISDALVVATYDLYPETTQAPNKGALELGDVNADGIMDISDALLIATYELFPDNPNLPSGMAGSIFNSTWEALKPVSRAVSYPKGAITFNAEVRPEAGETTDDLITLSLSIRMSGVAEKLGACAGRVQWDPTRFAYLGYRLTEHGPAYVGVTERAVGEGRLRFNLFDTGGVAAEAELVQLRFQRISEGGDSPLNVEVTNATAAYGFQDLLPSVEVAKPQFLGVLPSRFALHQNFPNPLNPQTTIAFDMPRASQVRLEVYNLLGQQVRMLTEGFVLAGKHQVVWDGRDGHGQEVGSGVYFVRLVAGETRLINKMMVLK